MINEQRPGTDQLTLSGGGAASTAGPIKEQTGASKTVLLVDDDDTARIFVSFVIRHLTSPVSLQYVRGGFEAMHYLEGEGKYSDRKTYPVPDLILLDLKMPLVDGFEVLEWIRAQPALAHLPVVVLTGSAYPPDVARGFQLGASAFIVKVVELLDFQDCLKNVLERFLMTSALAGEGLRGVVGSSQSKEVERRTSNIDPVTDKT